MRVRHMMVSRVHAVPLGLSQAYLLESDAGLVLVDAGSPHQERLILRHLRALNSDNLRPTIPAWV